MRPLRVLQGKRPRRYRVLSSWNSSYARILWRIEVRSGNLRVLLSFWQFCLAKYQQALRYFGLQTERGEAERNSKAGHGPKQQNC